MASHRTISKMQAAVRWCMNEYSGIDKLLLKVGSYPEEWIFEVMAKWSVSKRTAREYLGVAAAKLRLTEKERKEQEEMLLSSEIEQILGDSKPEPNPQHLSP